MSSLAHSVKQNDASGEIASVATLTRFDMFAASIAHEVNQPLTGIITNASTCLRMLAADPPNVAGALETAQRTIRDGNRATDVIQRLRCLFSMKGTTNEMVNLNEAAREAVALLGADFDGSQVTWRLELADNLPPVTADRIQLQQVILNLLRNAVDAMSEVNGRPKQLIVRTERMQRDSVCLSVEDVGTGIDPMKTERLFDPFFTTKTDGMGIGLSVSRAIIESHRGHLWAARNDGQGMTFSFVLPCKPDAIAESLELCLAAMAAEIA
jgi:C4-dicarboxylate-specific signal transduction histidine kinase